MNESIQTDLGRERISALADGELDPQEAQAALEELLGSKEAQTFWLELHATGDCLRSEETGCSVSPEGFMERFSAVLAGEPVLLARRAPVGKAAPQRAWLRYGLPGASIAAGIAMVLWMAIPQISPTDSEVAQATTGLATAVVKPAVEVNVAPAPDAVPAKIQIDPEQVGEYLTAHQGSVQAASLTIISIKADSRP
jgi:sigma-E factor negative regulatory protein RseA